MLISSTKVSGEKKAISSVDSGTLVEIRSFKVQDEVVVGIIDFIGLVTC